MTLTGHKLLIYKTSLSGFLPKPMLFHIDNRLTLYYLLRQKGKFILQHRTRPDPTRRSTRPADNSDLNVRCLKADFNVELQLYINNTSYLS